MSHIFDYPADIVRVLLFLSFVAALYGAAGWLLLRWVLIRIGFRTRSRFDAAWIRAAIFSAAFIGILCVLYGHYIEPTWVEVTHTALTSPKLTKPFRIVHVSDFHSRRRHILEGRLPGIIAAEKPDIIVFTGDALNTRAGIGVFRECLIRLKRIAPVYAVWGNWDAWYWNYMDLYGKTGVTELKAQTGIVRIPDAPVSIMGVSVGQEEKIPGLLLNVSTNTFNIFLCHYPFEIDLVSKFPIDLYCAGHTHGGQFRLPFFGALMTSSPTGRKYVAGLYRVRNTWLYISRGVGLTGGLAPDIRFLARREVSVIDIKPEPPR